MNFIFFSHLDPWFPPKTWMPPAIYPIWTLTLSSARTVQRAGHLRYLTLVQRVEEAILEAFPQASPLLRVEPPRTALERILEEEELF